MDTQRKIVLCGKKNCCLEISTSGEFVTIKDDFSTTIRITKEQFVDLGRLFHEKTMDEIFQMLT